MVFKTFEQLKTLHLAFTVNCIWMLCILPNGIQYIQFIPDAIMLKNGKILQEVTTHIFSFEISHWKSITFETQEKQFTYQKHLVTDYGHCRRFTKLQTIEKLEKLWLKSKVLCMG